KARCAACHEGWNFTNDGFQDIGLPSQDVGRGEYLPDVIKMKHAFKTPGLREIGRRSPYMHDGSLATLEAVVEHYDRGGPDESGRRTLRSGARGPSKPFRPHEATRADRTGEGRPRRLREDAGQQSQ